MRELQLVMHGIAVKKYGSVEEISSIIGRNCDDVRSLVQEAVAKGRVTEANGKYILTPAGQVTLKSVYSKAYGSLRRDEDFIAAYERFERINNELKQVITDWQTIKLGGQIVANDHSDATYDESIIDRLGKIHERVDLVLEQLAQQESRLHTYRQKLLSALEHSEDGDIRWVSDPTIDSYHTVWFELHEDILRIMGREREES